METEDCKAEWIILGKYGVFYRLASARGERLTLMCSIQLYGQQDRYVLSLKSSTFEGGYQQSAKVHLPPSDYSYSDTGMFFDEDTGEQKRLAS